MFCVSYFYYKRDINLSLPFSKRAFRGLFIWPIRMKGQRSNFFTEYGQHLTENHICSTRVCKKVWPLPFDPYRSNKQAWLSYSIWITVTHTGDIKDKQLIHLLLVHDHELYMYSESPVTINITKPHDRWTPAAFLFFKMVAVDHHLIPSPSYLSTHYISSKSSTLLLSYILVTFVINCVMFMWRSEVFFHCLKYQDILEFFKRRTYCLYTSLLHIQIWHSFRQRWRIEALLQCVNVKEVAVKFPSAQDDDLPVNRFKLLEQLSLHWYNQLPKSTSPISRGK